MKALIQRVNKASVSVNGDITGRISRGLVALIGVGKDDGETDARYLADKTAQLRISADSDGKFNLSAIDISGGILVVSQFTLMAYTAKGRRPSFTDAAPPQQAEELINQYISCLKETGLKVQTGVFQAYMQVEIHNDGPVTIMLDSKDSKRK
ncbi:MAG: D-tyrosyl-tRNA(Tyr) deacylase [Chloroflexi bacterium]|nr:D-tyrosyl-tRNA(Tyr) deacylase [Chloroflexota bacterium]